MTLPHLKHLAMGTFVLAAFTCSGSTRAQAPQAISTEVAEMFDAPLHGQLLALTSPAMHFAASEMGTSRLVKGAPYSADAVSESTQVLMDGNKIQRRSVQRLSRDGEGRMRVERLKQDGSVESVMINDVVAGKRYWLLPDKKRVVELPARVSQTHVPPVPPLPPAPGMHPTPPAPPPGMTSEEARSWGEEMRQWAREMSARLRDEQAADADARARVIVKQVREDDDADRSLDVDVVRVIESSNDTGDGAVAIAAIPPVPLAAGPTGQGVTTALGSKEFDRVRADGSRTTWTIPAGKIGNEKPIDVVSERWYSPELLLVVSSRYFDPRRGETTYRLASLKRGEPNASLFQVPADYERRPGRAKREERGKN
jgi:hypothetical protein